MKKILLSLLVVIPVAYGLDLALSQLFRGSHHFSGEIEVWEDIYNGRINCDIAVYGSSRAWVHVNPTLLEKNTGKTTYNFGIDGHNFELQYLRHLEYLRHNPKPKTIILSLDEFTFDHAGGLFNKNQFLPYMLWNPQVQKYTSHYRGVQQGEYYIPLLRYFGEGKAILSELKRSLGPANENASYRSQGFRGMDRQWNQDLTRAKKTYGTVKVEQSSANLDLFENFILECKRHEIELILLYSPEHIEGQDFVENRSDILKRMVAFSEKHELLFMDYSNHAFCTNRSLFYNAMHLNKTGADLFTADFSNRLQHYWKSSPHQLHLLAD